MDYYPSRFIQWWIWEVSVSIHFSAPVLAPNIAFSKFGFLVCLGCLDLTWRISSYCYWAIEIWTWRPSSKWFIILSSSLLLITNRFCWVISFLFQAAVHFKAHAHWRCPVCKEQNISTGSKPEHCVSWTPRRVAYNWIICALIFTPRIWRSTPGNNAFSVHGLLQNWLLRFFYLLLRFLTNTCVIWQSAI